MGSLVVFLCYCTPRRFRCRPSALFLLFLPPVTDKNILHTFFWVGFCVVLVVALIAACGDARVHVRK